MATTSPGPGVPSPRRNATQWRPGEWDWQRDAHCRDLGTDLFFARENQPRHKVDEQEQRAKHYCRSCTVRLDCLRHALRTPEHHGVWGETTSKERSDLAGTRMPRSGWQQRPAGLGAGTPATSTPRRTHTTPDSRPVTNADVAGLAGVSPSTVSRALAGVQVDDETRRKVLDAAAAIGYRSSTAPSQRCATPSPRGARGYW